MTLGTKDEKMNEPRPSLVPKSHRRRRIRREGNVDTTLGQLPFGCVCTELWMQRMLGNLPKVTLG